MLKRRIIAVLIIKNGIVVQSIGFERYLPVGKPEIAVEFLNQWGVDEIVILDMDATPKGSALQLELFRRLSAKCFVPLSIGGGIASVEDIQSLIHHGADKVCINHTAVNRPEFIKEAAAVFGSQCIVVAIDVKRREEGSYEIYTKSATEATGLDPVAFARHAERMGAGELLVNCIDRDGCKEGFDVDLMAKIASSVSIPVIALGGAGKPEHFVRLLEHSDVSAAAAANFFHYFEHSVTVTKSYVEKAAPNEIRLDNYFNYKDADHATDNRIAKKSDEVLAEMLFEFHEKEVI